MQRIQHQNFCQCDCYIPKSFGCHRHCPKCNKTQTRSDSRIWPNIPPPKLILPPECTQVEACEDICCASKPESSDVKATSVETCFRCDHAPPPLLRFNYSTRDGEFDPKSKLATYETTTNFFHGRKPFLDYFGCQDPHNMRTPRFLEISPMSLRFKDQRP